MHISECSAEAKAAGYRSGIGELTFLTERVIRLEQRIVALEAHIKVLIERIPPHLRDQEVRG